ncbi:MAG: dihydroorotase [Saprospiraceae bacterium]|nr:dihydroorotase [Saprospiraceae bacterium]
MKSILIKNGQVVNKGQIKTQDIFIRNGLIEKIDNLIDVFANIEIDATNKYVIPGIIDDQVHFREPGLTHKATIQTEARAAVAGGVTSFMEMPNVNPPSVTQQLLQHKYDIAAHTSLANYSFFMGATNDNLEEVLKTDAQKVCGIKAFMGSSTGNMLVDNPTTLENLFLKCSILIATHCEDEATIRKNTAEIRQMLETRDMEVTAAFHPVIRNHESCYLSSHFAVELAKKHNTRLHILHISTAEEIALFDNSIPLSKKRITSEVCVHHLYFNESQYATLGNLIKCNPAIKSKSDQKALFQALLDDRFDIIATDHAPHTWEEKSKPYFDAPSGLPLVQHSLNLMLSFYFKGKISLERIVEKMCHAPAICFQIDKRGFLDEGNWADLAIIDLNKKTKVTTKNIHYKCKWSPIEGKILRGGIDATIVSGHIAYQNGQFFEEKMGERLLFNR